MRTIGFIGYGQMNRMLIEGFLDTGILDEKQIIVSNRTAEKTTHLPAWYPAIRLTTDNGKLAADADCIIIGVRPLDLVGVLQEVATVTKTAHVISLAACVRIKTMAAIYQGPITRILPTVCSTVGEGVSLICHHERVSTAEADEVTTLFSSISTVRIVAEELFEPAGDLTSCGPALLTRMFMELAQAGSRHSALSEEECLEMIVSTAFGTTLMLKEGVAPDDLIRRVATPGGITEEGVKIIAADLPDICDRIFSTTLSKYELLRRLAEER